MIKEEVLDLGNGVTITFLPELDKFRINYNTGGVDIDFIDLYEFVTRVY